MNTSKTVIMILLLSAALSFLIYNQLDYLNPDYPHEKYILTEEDYEYHLDTPDEQYNLPPILNEISGISFYKKNKILCVQDELGLIFRYDFKNRTIDQELKFGENGDYEGLEWVDPYIYVMDSDGDLFYFTYQNEVLGEKKEIDTHLTSKNDTEGLGYDALNNALLIACKESGDSKKEEVKGKAVYQVDLSDKDFKRNPVLNIEEDELEAFLEEKKLKVKHHDQFSPSAIATHTSGNGDIFILASVGKLLLVLDRNGKYKNAIPLDPEVFRQPEGITFDDVGNLYISSEGRGSNGYILKFRNRL